MHLFLKKATFFLIGAVFFLLGGCGSPDARQEPITAQSFKLNTIITISIYDSQDQSLLDHCMELCDYYEGIFSRTDENSELYKLNHHELEDSNGVSQISQELAKLIEEGTAYSKLSQGAFDITIGPVSSLWDFTSEEKSVPRKTDIQAALSHVGYENLIQNQRQIQFKDPRMQVDLGAIAKGYIADRLKEYLLSQGVGSATINLGGNVLCIGSHPDGKPFKIGIQKPFAQRNEFLSIVEITDKSVVSSGVYERYFEEEGILYHHLLDSHTGYPCDNDLTAVTIISDRSVDGDGLSTACFTLGLEKGMELVESMVPKTYAFFVTKDNKIHYSKDFQKDISVTESS